MPTTTVSSKGQITLPAALLRQRHLAAGSKLEVIDTEGAIVLIPVDGTLTSLLSGSITGVYGDARRYIDADRNEWPSTR